MRLWAGLQVLLLGVLVFYFNIAADYHFVTVSMLALALIFYKRTPYIRLAYLK